MTDKKIRLLTDIGHEVKRIRKQKKISATALSQKVKRSRDTLYRLEKGEEVTTGALLDFLIAMGCTLRIESLTLPTLEEMRQRFGEDDD